jgi:formate hydrogenlyase transcriptional activator
MSVTGLAKADRDRTIERYNALLRVNDVISQHRDLNELFQHIATCLRQIVSFEIIAIGMYDPESHLIRVTLLSSEVPTPVNVGLTISPDTMPGGTVMRTQKPVVVRVDEESPFKFHQQMMRSQGAKISYHLPLSTSLTKLGVLVLGSFTMVELDSEELEFLQRVANQVAVAIENALNFEQAKALQEKLVQEKLYLEDEIRSESNFEYIIGQNSGLKAVLRHVETVAPSDSTVLILGETGTGKELIARAIHQASKRNARTFVKLNCAAIPTGLLESELFGHERGAFTGAIAQKIGRLELANGGTLFLDEVGDIPVELQPKLLRALQEREFERLGSTRTQKVDLRLIAATNRDLSAMIQEKQFRSDLYYRLNVFPIRIPPLRERVDDIPGLTRYFVSKFAKKMDKQIEAISSSSMNALQQWSWPGNVRELENVIERAVILTNGEVLNVPEAEFQISPPQIGTGDLTLQSTEREHILKVLRETNGVLSGPDGAAIRLGMKRTTLQHRMKKLGITREHYA